MNFNLQSVWTDYVGPWGTELALALLILVLGYFAARWLSWLVAKQMHGFELGEMLIRLVRKTVYYALLVAVVLAALDQLGIDTTSMLAALGAIGLAVGLAVKDSLSNFVAGVMVALFQPFRLGHYIEVAGSDGTVVDVGLFSTTLLTPDNKRIVVPNRLVYDDTIVNYSAEATRRVDMVFGIGYEDDIATARALIESIIDADKRILKDPKPVVAVSELADSSVNFVVRPWCKKDDYWGVRFSMTEQIKRSFDEQGISIPYPQRDVHMYEASAEKQV